MVLNCFTGLWSWLELYPTNWSIFECFMGSQYKIGKIYVQTWWSQFAVGHFWVHLSLHFKVRLSLCHENQFSFILKLELIIITKISHLDSLWKRDYGKLGNGQFQLTWYFGFYLIYLVKKSCVPFCIVTVLYSFT